MQHTRRVAEEHYEKPTAELVQKAGELADRIINCILISLSNKLQIIEYLNSYK